VTEARKRPAGEPRGAEGPRRFRPRRRRLRSASRCPTAARGHRTTGSRG
jgi:hypothetical protein